MNIKFNIVSANININNKVEDINNIHGSFDTREQANQHKDVNSTIQVEMTDGEKTVYSATVKGAERQMRKAKQSL